MAIVEEISVAQPSNLIPHYPTTTARWADMIVHAVGLVFALFGGGVLLGLAFSLGSIPQVGSISIYVVAFITMLGLSAAYNFATVRWQPLLNRFDQAGIFLMIAGSYTPFTTQKLHGVWAIGMTAAVWALAGIGIVGQLFLPALSRRFWVVLYLALGWIVLVAIKPMVDELSWAALLLLSVGGLVYSVGAVFFLAERLKFRLAIWHGHVVGGAVLHYIAVLVGVVLASSQMS